jgi:hypothetical protein
MISRPSSPCSLAAQGPPCVPPVPRLPVTPALVHQFVDKRGFVWLSEEEFVNHFAAFAKRMGATVVEVPSSHLAMVSHSRDVTRLTEAAAKAVFSLASIHEAS